MTNVPQKVGTRVATGLKKFQPLLLDAKARDVGEADTVTLIKDVMSEVFGYDKYSELTSEYAIRGTFCDLAIKVDGKLAILLEIKAIGLNLKDNHIKQATDYAANQGIDWVVLTNGLHWHVYKIIFSKPIDKELVVEFDISDLSHKNAKHIETLFLLCKEGWKRSALGDYHVQQQALSKYFLGAILQSDPVLDSIRRELRRVTPDVKLDNEQILDVLLNDIIKRDALDGEKAAEANKKVTKSANRRLKAIPKNDAPLTATNDPTPTLTDPADSDA